MNARVTFTFAVCILASATAHGAAVWGGGCYLEGQSNHGLTVVEIDGAALHLPVTTDCDGSYGWAVVAALQYHTFTYSHPGYEPETYVFWVPLGGGQLPSVTLESKAVCDSADWDHYPYMIPEANFTFPGVEGVHDPTSTYRAEWWYVNFHLTDEDNHEYGGFVAFFKPPIIGLPSMVLQSIIDLEDGIPYYSHVVDTVAVAIPATPGCMHRARHGVRLRPSIGDAHAACPFLAVPIVVRRSWVGVRFIVHAVIRPIPFVLHNPQIVCGARCINSNDQPLANSIRVAPFETGRRHGCITKAVEFIIP